MSKKVVVMPKHKEIRIILRCQNQPDKHAKILIIDECLGIEYAETLAELMDGTSRFYIYKPGPDSPIGKCATCGGQVKSEVIEVEKDAESKS